MRIQYELLPGKSRDYTQVFDLEPGNIVQDSFSVMWRVTAKPTKGDLTDDGMVKIQVRQLAVLPVKGGGKRLGTAGDDVILPFTRAGALAVYTDDDILRLV